LRGEKKQSELREFRNYNEKDFDVNSTETKTSLKLTVIPKKM